MNHHFPWPTIFTPDGRLPGITRQAAIQTLQAACLPLTQEEIHQVDTSERNPFPASDPMYKLWQPSTIRGAQMPRSDAFPPDYLSLLDWSNGGFFSNDRFSFAQLFPVQDVRGYMLAYLTPQYVPGLLPIGMDGGGNIHFLDLRHNSLDAPNCPLITLDAGYLEITDPRETHPSLWEACSGQPLPLAGP